MPSPVNVHPIALYVAVLLNGAPATPAAAGRKSSSTILIRLRMSRTAAGKLMDQKVFPQQLALVRVAAVKSWYFLERDKTSCCRFSSVRILS
jgi:hypothetical protein